MLNVWNVSLETQVLRSVPEHLLSAEERALHAQRLLVAQQRLDEFALVRWSQNKRVIAGSEVVFTVNYAALESEGDVHVGLTIRSDDPMQSAFSFGLNAASIGMVRRTVTVVGLDFDLVSNHSTLSSEMIRENMLSVLANFSLSVTRARFQVFRVERGPFDTSSWLYAHRGPRPRGGPEFESCADRRWRRRRG